MSRYEELAEVAKGAEQKLSDRNKRVLKFVAQFLNKFSSYCGIPSDRLKLLPWVEEEQVFQARTDELIGLPQAIHFDEKNDEWGIGVCIILTSSNSFPRRAVTSGLFVKEDDYHYSIRMGALDFKQIDLNVQPQCEDYFESIFKQLKEAFEKPRRNTNGKYGFRIET